MPRRDWRVRMQDILDAARKVVGHTGEMDFNAFARDEWSIDAVLRNLTVIGEAAGHIPDDVCAQHPEVPWRDMRDMRNIVVHEYFGVDLTMVWSTVREDLPALIPQLEEILQEEQDH